MAEAAKVCIKCGYERRSVDTAPPYQCPQCQVIYAKAEQAALGRTFTPQEQQQTKRCPDCGEQVLAIALKCKHCGSRLGKTDSHGEVGSGVDLGVPLLLLPLGMSLLIWLWVGGMALIQNPFQALTVLSVIVLLGTASMAAWEVSSAPAQKRARTKLGPVGWFIVITLFWIFAYPLYLFARTSLGMKSRFGSGVIVALVFLSISSSMAFSINKQQERVQQQIEEIARMHEENARRFQQEAEEVQRNTDRLLREMNESGYNP